MKIDLYKAVIDYDEKFDLLSLRRPGLKTTFNLEAGNLVFDFTNRDFVGLEIQDASRWLSDLAGAGFNLSSLTNAKIGFQDKSNFMRLLLVLSFGSKQMEKELIVQKFEPIAIPA